MDNINWLGWEKESFEKAKKEDKPVLLDISAIWCYWCERIEKDTYVYKEVINLINEKFIPIRVDTNKRPDINNRYNLGGWPSVVVLNKKGTIITGCLYLPPLDFLSFLQNALLVYVEKNEENLESNLNTIKKFQNPSLSKLKNLILNTIEKSYDPYYGGFFISPKFPHHSSLSLLLLLYDEEANARVIVDKTLASMAENEIFDKEEGGFYRYSAMQDWSKPHYEKLLDDNARLVIFYLALYKLTELEKFKDIALKTLNFIQINFLDKEKGFFYASQKADEKYSHLNLKERKESKKLFIDKTLFADFNCYAISSFLFASKILNKEEYKTIALKALDFLVKNLQDKNGIKHYFEDSVQGPYLLKNNLLLISSLLESEQENYIILAEEIMEKTSKNFFNEKEGLFSDIFDLEDSFGYLKIKRNDIEENSLAVKVLLNLYNSTKNNKYFDLSKKIINNIKDLVDQNSLYSASFAESVILYEKLN